MFFPFLDSDFAVLYLDPYRSFPFLDPNNAFLYLDPDHAFPFLDPDHVFLFLDPDHTSPFFYPAHAFIVGSVFWIMLFNFWIVIMLLVLHFVDPDLSKMFSEILCPCITQ